VKIPFCTQFDHQKMESSTQRTSESEAIVMTAMVALMLSIINVYIRNNRLINVSLTNLPIDRTLYFVLMNLQRKGSQRQNASVQNTLIEYL